MTLKVKGSLHIAFPVENDPSFCAEVKSWQDISMFGSAKSLLVAANTLRSIRAAQLDALDFVFVSSSTREARSLGADISHRVQCRKGNLGGSAAFPTERMASRLPRGPFWPCLSTLWL
jgi:hypothetical protein